jgi:hypothetical protein
MLILGLLEPIAGAICSDSEFEDDVPRNQAERKAGNWCENTSFPIGSCPTPRVSKIELLAQVSLTKQENTLSPTSDVPLC